MPVFLVDEFVGKWQDTCPTEQILQDIHNARTSNDDIDLVMVTNNVAHFSRIEGINIENWVD